jgi:molybdate-binding protein
MSSEEATLDEVADTIDIDKDIDINKKKVKVKKKYSEFVSLTEEQYQKLIEKYGETNTKKFIEKLDNYKGATGKKYKDDYRAILNWVVEEVSKKEPIDPYAGAKRG